MVITAMQYLPPVASRQICNQWSLHMAAACCVGRNMAAHQRAPALDAITITWARIAATDSCKMDFSASTLCENHPAPFVTAGMALNCAHPYCFPLTLRTCLMKDQRLLFATEVCSFTPAAATWLFNINSVLCLQNARIVRPDFGRVRRSTAATPEV